ncbi:hypothetical protein DFQ26_004970 [Actinomortierella ambigua]|nr:hypothetical protein DFQ26_004970 [Actinomortierella ambigua]
MSTSPLPAPKSDIYTAEQLSQYSGADESKPIYVAIKGTIFDVSSKRQMYGPGAGYHVFAGKDASKALGMSSLKLEDCVADYSGLDEKEASSCLFFMVIAY